MLPTNPNINSHMNLRNGGFGRSDASEIRLFCYEFYNGIGKFIHFKTTSEDFINTAFDDNQQYLKRRYDFKITDLETPPEIRMYSRAIGEYNYRELNYFGVNPHGGFIDTAFGITDYEQYWTVRGNNRDLPVYECGGYHRYNGGFASDTEGPNMVRSYHAIYIRGNPPPLEYAQRRFYSKLK